MKEQLLSTLLQCLVLIGIPLIVYILFKKEKNGFFKWIGLHKPKNNKWVKWSMLILVISIVVMAGTIIVYTKLGTVSENMLYSLDYCNNKFSFEIVFIVLLKGIFQTALSEEVLFRGFIGKNISRKFGYLWGNLVQSALFGLIHGLPFILAYKVYPFGISLFFAASIVGYLQFYINEKKADGSIMPSILIHSIINIISNA